MLGFFVKIKYPRLSNARSDVNKRSESKKELTPTVDRSLVAFIENRALTFFINVDKVHAGSLELVSARLSRFTRDDRPIGKENLEFAVYNFRDDLGVFGKESRVAPPVPELFMPNNVLKNVIAEAHHPDVVRGRRDREVLYPFIGRFAFEPIFAECPSHVDCDAFFGLA
jgi:hypothetical protein